MFTPPMTALPFRERLTEQFGRVRKNSYSHTRVMDLHSHYKWLLTDGRFGHRFEVKNRKNAFEFLDLDGEVFSKTRFENTRFYWSNLRFTNFAGAELRNVEFEGCDLEEADFAGATLEDVSFINCTDIHLARFENATVIKNGHVIESWQPEAEAAYAAHLTI
jgi:hypothetical protein